MCVCVCVCLCVCAYVAVVEKAPHVIVISRLAVAVCVYVHVCGAYTREWVDCRRVDGCAG